MIEKYRKMFAEGRGDDVMDDALNQIIQQPDTTADVRHVAEMMLKARPA